jgi:hypothetical protein
MAPDRRKFEALRFLCLVRTGSNTVVNRLLLLLCFRGEGLLHLRVLLYYIITRLQCFVARLTLRCCYITLAKECNTIGL